MSGYESSIFLSAPPSQQVVQGNIVIFNNIKTTTNGSNYQIIPSPSAIQVQSDGSYQITSSINVSSNVTAVLLVIYKNYDPESPMAGTSIAGFSYNDIGITFTASATVSLQAGDNISIVNAGNPNNPNSVIVLSADDNNTLLIKQADEMS